MTDLQGEQKTEILNRLRAARYLVLRDAEAFHEAATELEYVGQVISGQMRYGLAKYKREIVDLALLTKRHDAAEIGKLFEVVREARNDAVHVGAHVRHLNSRLVDLILILEEAIMMGMLNVEDLMVRNPVVAEPWQLVAHVRNTILANSFSALPIRVTSGETECWKILTDTALIKFTKSADKETKQDRMSMTIEKALAEGLHTESATCVHPGSRVEEIVTQMQYLPILVTNATKESRLLGIITAFDLL